MPIPPRHPAFSFLCGLCILILAVAVRFWYVQDNGFESSPAGSVWQVQDRGPVIKPPDVTALDHLVNNLIAEGVPAGFHTWNPLGPTHEVPAPGSEKAAPRIEPVDEPAAGIAPLYPLLRSFIERMVGDHPEYVPMPPVAAVRMVQIGLGGLTCVLYFVIALRAFGNNYLLELLVGLATAVYPFWVINAAELEDGVLATFLLAWGLALGVRIGQKGGVIRSYLFGLVLAGLALTRAALLPFAVVAQLWFFLRCRRVPHGGLCALLTLVGFATGMTPWVLWTVQNYGRPVPVVSTAWYHLWLGNRETTQEVPDVARSAPADRYDHLAPKVIEEVAEHPIQTLKRRVRALGQFLFGISYQRDHAIVHQGHNSVPLPNWLRPTLIYSLLGIYLLALLGWRWSYGWRRHSAPVMLALYWIPLPYILSHAFALSSARLPLDGVFLLLAGVGFLGLIPGLGKRLLAGEDPPTAQP